MIEYIEKEKDNKAFVPLHSYEYMIYAPEYTEILDTIRVKEGMEKPIAENLLNNEQVKESVIVAKCCYGNFAVVHFLLHVAV